jgi:hypothetical protein
MTFERQTGFGQSGNGNFESVKVSEIVCILSARDERPKNANVNEKFDVKGKQNRFCVEREEEEVRRYGAEERCQKSNDRKCSRTVQLNRFEGNEQAKTCVLNRNEREQVRLSFL